MRLGSTAALVPLLCLSTLFGATAAHAAALDPQLAAAMLRPSDLSATYGTSKVWNNDLGKGVIPTPCTTGPSGTWAEGRVASTTYFKEVDYKKNSMMWQNTVYLYPSAADARSSYFAMLRDARRNCSSAFETTIGDDGEAIPATQKNVTTILPKADGNPRFTVATSTLLTDPNRATNTYHDTWGYGVFLLDGSVIHQVQVYQDAPVSRPERKDATAGVATVAGRFSSLP